MKKIFIQFWKWILRHKKKLLYGALALLVFQICFFSLGNIGLENQVFADDEGGGTSQSDISQEQAAKYISLFSFWHKIIKVLVYPLLLVAGKLVDNSLVYGEFFGFDAVLWQLWNIVKNLSNFALGFLLLYKIFRYLIGRYGGKSEDVKKILLSALIAGVGIQASWFVMAALIDVSTILTYGVGGLPFSVLKESIKSDNDEDDSNWDYNPAVFKNVVYVGGDLDTTHIYLSSTKTGDFLISECETATYGDTKEILIIAPRMIYYNDSGSGKLTDSNRCHYYGQVYYFSSLTGGLNDYVDAGSNKFSCGNSGCEDKQIAYSNALGKLRNNVNGDDMGIVGLISGGQILQIRDGHKEGFTGSIWAGKYPENSKRGLDVNNKRTGSGGTTSRLSDIMEGHSYIGVFTTLYASLMNSGEGILGTPEDLGPFASLLNVAITFFYILAVGVPLLVVVIVFMIRICVLWLAIALSPFIVLTTVFKAELGKIFEGDFWGHFELKKLIPIIFYPAIICFAISMSTVLVTIIGNFNTDVAGISTEPAKILGGLVTLNIGSIAIPMARLIVSVFGVAITWFIVWAAIEATSIGKSKFIKETIKGLTKDTLGGIPIIPIPKKDGKGFNLIGANTAFGLNNHESAASQIKNTIVNKYNNNSQTALDEWLRPETARENAETNAKTNAFDEYVKSLSTVTADKIGEHWVDNYSLPTEGPNGVITTTFNKLDQAQQEAVIKEINGLENEDQRKMFGNNTPKITIDGKDVWEFQGNAGKDPYTYKKVNEEGGNNEEPSTSS